MVGRGGVEVTVSSTLPSTVLGPQVTIPEFKELSLFSAGVGGSRGCEEESALNMR